MILIWYSKCDLANDQQKDDYDMILQRSDASKSDSHRAKHDSDKQIFWLAKGDSDTQRNNDLQRLLLYDTQREWWLAKVIMIWLAKESI